MTSTTIPQTSFQCLGYKEARTWLLAAIFIAGNIILPQICHFIPGGGPMLLPIYFFTLVAAYKYGWKAGLLTAVISPIANHLLFAMPSAAMLPVIEVKGILLATAAGLAAARYGKVTLLSLIAVVLAYQIVGTALEAAILGSLTTAIGDLRIAIPGMIAQVVLGYIVIKAIK